MGINVPQSNGRSDAFSQVMSNIPLIGSIYNAAGLGKKGEAQPTPPQVGQQDAIQRRLQDQSAPQAPSVDHAANGAQLDQSIQAAQQLPPQQQAQVMPTLQAARQRAYGDYNPSGAY